MIWRGVLWLLVASAALISCGPPPKLSSPPAIGISAVHRVRLEKQEQSNQFELIQIPITVFILDDTQETFSSTRSTDEIVEAHNRANEIWAQAGIQFKLTRVSRGTVPIALTANIIRWEVDDFFTSFDQLPNGFKRKNPVTGFFVHTVRGPNGIASAEHRAYFIADELLNEDGRVVAHELGHVLGLNHLNDSVRLMHSGSNGIRLTSAEIAIARKNAENLLK